VPLLASCVEKDEVRMAAVEALGIVGTPNAISELLRVLASPDDQLRVKAAEALQLISGVETQETVIRAAPFDPDVDEGPPEEREIERVNTSEALWTAWWRGWRGRVGPAQRLRRGDYFTLASCIDELRDPRSPYGARSRAYLELSVRAPDDIPYEPCWFAALQDAAIRRWQEWWLRQRRE
jgi:hypothetical protein